ncbi:MAG: hypothetical protein AB7U79_03690 [Candidatus Izemoplasmatales bacterium]
MLIKLIKHELIASYRTYVPIYVALYGLALMMFVTYKANTDSLFAILLGVFMLLLGAMSIFIIYNLVISLGSRVYGKPGYLLFSVPAKTWEIMLAKFLVNYMWVIVSIFVTASSFYLAFGLLGVWDEFASTFQYLWDMIGFTSNELWGMVFYAITYVAYLIFFFMFLFSLLNVIYKGEKKIFFGVLLYLAMNFVTNLINQAVINSFDTSSLSEGVMNYMFYLTFYYLILALIFGGLNYYLMNKKLELQ